MSENIVPPTDPEMKWVGLVFIIGMSVVAALVVVMAGGLGAIVL